MEKNKDFENLINALGEEMPEPCNDIFDFTGSFENFNHLWDWTNLSNMICRFYRKDAKTEYKIIVGCTRLGKDVLLHLIDAENISSFEEISEHIEDYGIEFRLLSQMLGEYGFDIVPSDQFVDEDFEDDEDDEDKEPNPTTESKEPQSYVETKLKEAQEEKELLEKLNNVLGDFEKLLEHSLKKSLMKPNDADKIMASILFGNKPIN